MERTSSQEKLIVNSVCASMRVEGFSVSQRTQRTCMDIVSGKKTASEMVKAKLAEYERK